MRRSSSAPPGVRGEGGLLTRTVARTAGRLKRATSFHKKAGARSSLFGSLQEAPMLVTSADDEMRT